MKRIILLITLVFLFGLSGCVFDVEDEPEEEYITQINLSKVGEMYFVEEQDGAWHLRIPTSYAKLDHREGDNLVEDMFGINAISPSYDSKFLIYTNFFLGKRKMFHEASITVVSGKLENKYNEIQEIVIRSSSKGQENSYDDQKFLIEFYDDVPVNLPYVSLYYNSRANRYDLEYQEDQYDGNYVNGEKMIEDIFSKIINENKEELNLNFFTNDTYEEEVTANEALELSRNDIKYVSSTFDELGKAYGIVYFTITDAGENITKSTAFIYFYDNVAPYLMKDGQKCKDSITLDIGEFTFKHIDALSQFIKFKLNEEGYIVKDNVSSVYADNHLLIKYTNKGYVYIEVTDGPNSTIYTDNTSMCNMIADMNINDGYIDFICDDYLVSYDTNLISKTSPIVILRKIINNSDDYIILGNDMEGCQYEIIGIKFKCFLDEHYTDYYYNSITNKYVSILSNNKLFSCDEGTVLMENDNDIKLFIGKNVNMFINSIMNNSETNKLDIYLEYSEKEYNDQLGTDGKRFYYSTDGKWLYGDDENYVLHFDYTLEKFEKENNLKTNED